MQQHQQIRFVLRWWSCVRCQGWMPTLKNIITKKKKSFLFVVFFSQSWRWSRKQPIFDGSCQNGSIFSAAIFVRKKDKNNISKRCFRAVKSRLLDVKGRSYNLLSKQMLSNQKWVVFRSNSTGFVSAGLFSVPNCFKIRNKTNFQ